MERKASMADYTWIQCLQIAVKSESNAAVFYRKAARSRMNLPERDLLLKMAAMEEKHKTFFEGLKRKAERVKPSALADDPYGDVKLFMDAIAETHGGEGSRQWSSRFTGKEKLSGILRMGLDAEVRAVAFYAGLKGAMTSARDRAWLDLIVSQERDHAVALFKMLRALDGKG